MKSFYIVFVLIIVFLLPGQVFADAEVDRAIQQTAQSAVQQTMDAFFSQATQSSISQTQTAIPVTIQSTAEAAISQTIAAISMQPTEVPVQPTKQNRFLDAEKTKAAQAAVIPTKASISVRSVDHMQMQYVSEGEFWMGSRNGDPDEKPEHILSLEAFWIDQTEVTNKQYAKCVKDGPCSRPQKSGSWTRNSYYDSAEFAYYPVINVSWAQASDYCRWVGCSLPTEAQWEKAARGTDERVFPWGNEYIPGAANDKQSFGDTREVGSYPAGASPYGVLDMAGNVWEWTADWYSDEYYYETMFNDPTGPARGTNRVIRGNSWYYDEYTSRTSKRSKAYPEYFDSFLGFRCVCAD